MRAFFFPPVPYPHSLSWLGKDYTLALRAGQPGLFFDLAKELWGLVSEVRCPVFLSTPLLFLTRFDYPQQSGMVRTQRKGLRSFEKCFRGCDLVQWLVINAHALNESDAALVGCTLLYHNVIHHVNDELHFKVLRAFLFSRYLDPLPLFGGFRQNSEQLYRWRYDDKSFICARPCCRFFVGGHAHGRSPDRLELGRLRV